MSPSKANGPRLARAPSVSCACALLRGSVFDRSDDNKASMINHFLLEEESPRDPRLSRRSDLPTLVVHDTADPMLWSDRGRALAGMIPGAQLVEIDNVGHQFPPPSTWDRLVKMLNE